MLDFLDRGRDRNPITLIAKINELIQAHNELYVQINPDAKEAQPSPPLDVVAASLPQQDTTGKTNPGPPPNLERSIYKPINKPPSE